MLRSQIFGNIQINPKYTIFTKDHVFAVLVHNPILDGHIILCPIKQVARYRDLETEQLFELALSTQLLTRTLEASFGAESCTISIQEGERAGQSINHLHVHIIPR